MMSYINNVINTPIKILFPGYAKKLGALKTFLEYLLSAIIFILIPIIAITLITSRTSAFFGIQSFVVVSGSMTPAMPVGSIVYTQKGSNINIGDVITFKRKGINITHRVVEITDKNGHSVSSLISPLPGAPLPKEIFYRTKGDANNTADSDLVSQKDVIGKTFINLPAVGKLTNYLKSLPGFLIFIIAPSLIFIAFELWNIKKEIEKATERKILQRMRVI